MLGGTARPSACAAPLACAVCAGEAAARLWEQDAASPAAAHGLPAHRYRRTLIAAAQFLQQNAWSPRSSSVASSTIAALQWAQRSVFS